MNGQQRMTSDDCERGNVKGVAQLLMYAPLGLFDAAEAVDKGV